MNEQIVLQEDEEVSLVNEDLTLIQKKNGLKYGTDALLLSAFIGRHSASSHAIELGTGTGIISLLCLKRDQIGNITALEVQKVYADLAERNAEINGLSSRLTVVHTDLRDFKGNEQADIVFTNPPYMKLDAGKKNEDEEKFIARHEAKGSILEFCKCGASMLKYGGSFYAVYRPDRLADLICAMREARLEPKRMLFVAQSKNHSPCLVLIEGKKGGNSGMLLPRTFFIKDASGEDSMDMKALLKEGIIYGK